MAESLLNALSSGLQDFGGRAKSPRKASRAEVVFFVFTQDLMFCTCAEFEHLLRRLPVGQRWLVVLWPTPCCPNEVILFYKLSTTYRATHKNKQQTLWTFIFHSILFFSDYVVVIPCFHLIKSINSYKNAVFWMPLENRELWTLTRRLMASVATITEGY